MAYPKHLVSYCTMSEEAGANPFWHGCLILSEQESETSAIEVKGSYGFYSTPSTTTHPIIKGIKHIIGIKFNLQDAHGEPKREELRDLDGDGLQAITFETTEEQYQQLHNFYKERIDAHAGIVNELDLSLAAKGVPANSETRYLEELSLAAREGREARLQKFHISMDLTRYGFDSSQSRTCKQDALNALLQCNIIDEDQLKEISGSKSTIAFPRSSGVKMLPIRMVSIGAQIKYQTSARSNRVLKSRDWDENTRLYLTLPPIPELSKENQKDYRLKHEWISKTLKRAHQLELKIAEQIVLTQRQPDYNERNRLLKDQCKRISRIYRLLSNASENDLLPCLRANLILADKILNVASFTLDPSRVDASFILRAYESSSVRYALLSLAFLVLAAELLSGVAAALAISAATVYAGRKLYGFYRDEIQFAKQSQDYLDMQAQTRPQTQRVLNHRIQRASSTPNLPDVPALMRENELAFSP